MNINNDLIFKNGGGGGGKGSRCKSGFVKIPQQERSWGSKFAPVEMGLILSPSSISDNEISSKILCQNQQ
ncbi:unnamed protein product [Moneuplotes crassus]|uniref:Uncharacterized protein n=1 Tax=Euplotes crassus TaxID=5936 RepID=A0AAD1U3U3_EUPCR|nr:unnamed protein product [Moneuplotes crassus]